MFSWGQTHDERGGEDDRLSSEGKKHTDGTGDYKKTDQGKEKAKAITVQLNGRLKELAYESRTTILKFFLHISNNGRRERLGWVSQRGAAVTPFPHFFFYLGYVMWRRPRSSVGSNSPAATITASFFLNRFAGIRRSQWVCFMLRESMQAN